MKLERKEQNMELLEKVLDGQNIADAIEKVLSNKGAGGIDGVSIQKFKEEIKNGNINFEIIKEKITSRYCFKNGIF